MCTEYAKDNKTRDFKFFEEKKVALLLVNEISRLKGPMGWLRLVGS